MYFTSIRKIRGGVEIFKVLALDLTLYSPMKTLLRSSFVLFFLFFGFLAHFYFIQILTMEINVSGNCALINIIMA